MPSPNDNLFVIVQTGDGDMCLQCESSDQASQLYFALNNLLYKHYNGKLPEIFRGMRLSATQDGASQMTTEMYQELFGITVTTKGESL